MARPPVRIQVVITDDKPTLISSDFVPTTGSVGAAATAIAADTAVTSSFATTASFANNVISASFATTASFANKAASATSASLAANANRVQGEGSGTFTGSFIGQLVGTGSWAEDAVSASHALVAISASFAVSASSVNNAATASFLTGLIESASFATTASFLLGAIQSASIAERAKTASYIAAGNIDGVVVSSSHALQADNAQAADSASYIAGSDVDGAVALATLAAGAITASDVAYDDVRDKPTLISESVQITGQLDVTGVTGSFTGTFIGDGSGLSGINADTAQTASYVAGGNVDGAVELANTASYVGGGAVDGAVELANTASYVAGADVDGIVALATSASDVAYDDIRDKPTLVSQSAQFSSSDNFIVGQVNAVGVTGSFIGSGAAITDVILADSATLALGITGSDVVGAVGLSNTASYVAGADVDGTVELANTASYVAGANIDGAVSTASYVAGGNVDGAVATASYVAGGNVDGAVSIADTGSYVAGGNVDGAVELSNTASYVAGASVDGAVAALDGEGTGTFTGSFRGGINLTDPSDMSGSTFAHQMPAISGATGDFTISLDDNQLQQYEISASLGFFVEGGQVGGFYGIHFINQGGNVVTWPPAMKFHSGSAITSSVATGTLDIYTIHRLPDGTYVTAIFGQSIS
ncbi:hypothetical protein LCGC14_0718110 [marine sediment metagenome]|uniref:Uncharacterized protein n=1 Tax=marine sediment metagenome TaxID=412755 RepID=A0A0F9QHG6_9ZZZZ